MEPTPIADGIARYDGLRIPVDGETVSATRFEPTEAATPRPVIFLYTPYRKDDGPGDGGPFVPPLVEAGYEVVIGDVVGSGGSTGVQAEPFTAAEGRQAATVIEWLADRDWSTGHVGMTGSSYGGLLSLRAAVEDPDPLAAIVPVNATFAIYERRGVSSNSHFSGGAFAFQGRWAGGIQALRALPPARRDPEGRWAEIWRERLDGLREHTPWLFQYLAHESPRDGYWADKSLGPADLQQVQVPTFLTSGWRDSFVHPNTHYFEYLDAPKRLLLGPWRHTLPPDGREAAIAFWPQVVEWFDRFLKGDDNGATDWPTVTYWTERPGEGTPDAGAGTWRGREGWPTADDASLTFAVGPDGLVRRKDLAGAVETTYDPDYTVGIESTDRYGPPRDTNADDARSLAIESDPFTDPVELTGTGTATLRLTSDDSDPLVSVRVVDVAPDGAARLVTYGYLRASHRDGHDDPKPLAPDEEYTVRFPLKPTSHVVETDHRLRVAISAGFFPLMLPTRERGSLVVRSSPTAPSTVAFPGHVHDDAATFGETVGRGIQSQAPDPIGGPESALTTSREQYADTATFRSEGGGSSAFAYGECIETRGVNEASVEADDPSTAAIDTEKEVTLDYGHEEVTLVATSHISRDVARLSLETSLGGEPVFDETWTRFDPFEGGTD